VTHKSDTRFALGWHVSLQRVSSSALKTVSPSVSSNRASDWHRWQRELLHSRPVFQSAIRQGHTILNQVTYKLAFVIYIRVSDEAVQWKNTQSVSVTLSVFILLRVVHDNDGYCPPVSTKIT